MNRRTFAATAGVGLFQLWLESELDAQTCAALPATSTATPFTIPAGLPVVKRPSVIELAQPARAAELARFRNAVKKMQDLTPATNPLKFNRQVNLHCNHCGVGTGEIHYNWQFLPWHRAMLFFHEAILNKLAPPPAGQPPIRVPYWPWEDLTNPANQKVPAIYGAASQSLFHPRNPAGPLAPGLVNVQPALVQGNSSDFIGTASSSSVNFTGPHANVHNWARADLSDLRFSPLDPLFYAHHANIDRLWSSWIALGGGRTNPNFGTVKAYFFDETGRWRSILLNDVRDESKLGNGYTSLMRLQTTPLTTPFDLTVSSNQVSAPTDSASTARQTTATTLLLRGVKLGALNKESIFGVFVEGGDTGSTASPYFVGQFSTVMAVNAEPEGSLTVAMPATNLKPRLAAKPKLVMRALDQDGKSKGTAIPLSARSVSLL